MKTNIKGNKTNGEYKKRSLLQRELFFSGNTEERIYSYLMGTNKYFRMM